jgi:tRNA(Ile)-lysidine synthase
MKPLLNKVQQTIRKNKLIKKGDKVIVGVSGGPDSICLLHILYQLRIILKLRLIVAHVNYGYREKEADKDEKYVRELAKKLKLKCKVLQPSAFKLQSSANLEAQFRDIRYQFFNDILKKEKANKIAVAHTENDQMETILMFFLRGSGLRGLSGMDYKRDKIIRPLLDCLRGDILAYLKENNLRYRTDVTNEDTTYTRNKIRRKLIPYLEKEFNPNLSSTLIQNAKVIRDDYDFINQATKLIYQSLKKKRGKAIELDLKKFLRLFKALQRGILRLILAEFLKDIRGVSVLDIEETLRILKESKPGSFRDIKDLLIFKKDGKIVASKKI